MISMTAEGLRPGDLLRFGDLIVSVVHEPGRVRLLVLVPGMARLGEWVLASRTPLQRHPRARPRMHTRTLGEVHRSCTSPGDGRSAFHIRSKPGAPHGGSRGGQSRVGDEGKEGTQLPALRLQRFSSR